MANYPTFAQVVGSTAAPKSGIRVDRATSGKARAQVFYTADLYDFVVKHLLDETDRDSLLSHYSGDKENTFLFTWKGDDTAYTVLYTNKPQVKPIGNGYYECESRLAEVG